MRVSYCCLLPGAHESKEHQTSRNGVSTMKYLTRKVVIPYKEAQFTHAIQYTPTTYSVFHIR